MGLRPAAAVALSAAISVAGHRAGALSTDGALAASGVGSAVLARCGWRGAAVLGAFFVSSSALSQRRAGTELAARGSRRDAVQVAANGGVAACAALLSRRSGLTLAAGSLAAATADTWATEIGRTSESLPRMVLSRAVVPAGTSGAVTWRGTLGSLLGAGLIGLVHLAGDSRGRDTVRPSAAVIAGGIAGSLVDSVLGELVQEKRYCPACGVATESKVHRCGTATDHVGGVPGLNNDVVNGLCTLAGALVAWIVGGASRTTSDR
ncbi:MAG: DUF92 domain-containing protein [Thermomicrobiales bacterium]|nr:DUF92 domain-containing protein [Thermomicrobiales bacterium]